MSSPSLQIQRLILQPELFEDQINKEFKKQSQRRFTLLDK